MLTYRFSNAHHYKRCDVVCSLCVFSLILSWFRYKYETNICRPRRFTTSYLIIVHNRTTRQQHQATVEITALWFHLKCRGGNKRQQENFDKNKMSYVVVGDETYSIHSEFLFVARKLLFYNQLAVCRFPLFHFHFHFVFIMPRWNISFSNLTFFGNESKWSGKRNGIKTRAQFCLIKLNCRNDEN